MRVLLPLLMLIPAAASAQVTVETSGVCGGPIAIDVAGLTPRGTVFAVTSAGLGSAEVPAGPCAGTYLGLGEVGSALKLRASAEGTLSVAPTLPPGVCGRDVVFVDAATCAASAPASLGGDDVNVTFRVDMGCSGLDAFSSVHVTGPWAGWSTDYRMVDPDGDGVYTTTVPFARGAVVEYKFMVDEWASQENLVDDMVAGGSCAPVTDYFSYANRLETASSDLVLSAAYGRCGFCGSGPVPVEFAVDMRCAGFAPSSVALPGPDVGWSFSRTLADSDGDGIWTGSFDLEEGTFLEFKVAANDWAFQEDLVDDMLGGASCAPITDYFSYANRLILVEGGSPVEIAYGTCGACVL